MGRDRPQLEHSVTAALLAILTAVTPVRTAETVPAGKVMLHAAGGFNLLDIGIPGVPFAPVLTGDLEIAWGLLSGLDLRGRYSTQLGLIHRLGPEVRFRFAGGDAWAVGARLHPSVQVAGAANDGVDVGGDVSTYAGALGTVRFGEVAVTLDAGVTVQWLLFEDIDGRRFTDTEPYLAFGDVAVEVEWARRTEGNYSLRLELAVPTAPDDPFTVLAVFPRLVFGGNFAL